MGANRCLTRQRVGFLAALCRRMGIPAICRPIKPRYRFKGVRELSWAICAEEMRVYNIYFNIWLFSRLTIATPVILFPISLYPLIGVFVSGYFKALGTARYLHKPVGLQVLLSSWSALTLRSISRRRKWQNTKWQFSWRNVNGIINVLFKIVFCQYRTDSANVSCQVFGFATALLESLPVLGLIFTISNRVGAAMWAHGLCPYFIQRDPHWLSSTSQTSKNVSTSLLCRLDRGQME